MCWPSSRWQPETPRIPAQNAPNLRAEREACGIAEARLDRVVARSEALGPGVRYGGDESGWDDSLLPAIAAFVTVGTLVSAPLPQP